MKANRSKISRLPFEVRYEACMMLHNGATNAAVKDWLNARPELAALGVGAVTDQNMTDWLRGGYKDWLRLYTKTERVARFAEASEMIAARAEGSATKVAANVIANALAEVAEVAEGEGWTAESVEKLSRAVVALGNIEIGHAKLAIARDELKLAREKFAALQTKLESARQGLNPATPMSEAEREAKYREIFGG